MCPRETYTELLLLRDGRILVRNLTPAMAAVLQELDPQDRGMVNRAKTARSEGRKHRTGQQTHPTSHKP